MKFIILIFFFIYLTAGFVSGQWSSKLESGNSPICVMPDTQYNVQVVSDANEGAYIAWEDKRSGRWRIYIQYVNERGIPQWTTNGIPVCNDTVYQKYFDMQYDGNGGVFLVWEDRRFNRNSIFAQRINSSGNLLWGDEGLNVFDSLHSYYPKILSLNGNAIISWHSYYSGGFAAEMYVQKINSSGSKLWGNNGKRLTSQSNDQWYGEIISGGNDNAIVIWNDERTGYGIYAQKIDGNGNTLWTTNGVLVSNTSPYYRTEPKAVYNGSGGAIIAWQNQMSQFGPYHIYAQHINSAGSKQWQPQGIPIASQDTINYELSMIPGNSDETIISWNFVDNGPYTTARIQKINNSGTKLWGGAEGLDVCPLPGTYSHVFDGLVSDGSGGVIIASFDTRNDINDIYSYRFNSSGLRVWDSLGIAICNRDSAQMFPRIAKNNSGVIIAWEDWVSGKGDIYCQKVDNKGILAGITQISSHVPKKYLLNQNYPNPFNPATKIRFDIPFKTEIVKLAVYNSLGQQVALLVDEELSPGSYEYTFDGSAFASGVYFYSIQTDGFTDTKKMLLVK